MIFEWNEAKSDLNRKMRNIGFEIVYELDWEKAQTIKDDRFDYGEDRFLSFFKEGSAYYCVCFTLRNNKIRIISVRRARKKEAQRFGL